MSTSKISLIPREGLNKRHECFIKFKIVAYWWQMTKPVTNHRNRVRIWIRKVMPERIWKFLLWRPIYNRSIQNHCAVWFTFFLLLILYWCYVGMWILDMALNTYSNDSAFGNMAMINLFWCWYIAISSMALEMIIMFVVLTFMFFAFIGWFWWLIMCPRFLSWTPPNNNRVDREYDLVIRLKI